MLERLKSICAETGQDKLIPILHLSCWDIAKLIQYILGLCAPAFKECLSDWFVPLADELGTRKGDKICKFPDGISMDSLFMKGLVVSNLTDFLYSTLFNKTTKEFTYVELSLSAKGELFETRYPGSREEPITVDRLSIDAIARKVYMDDHNPIASYLITLIDEVMSAVSQNCYEKNPDLCAEIAAIKDKVDFSYSVAVGRRKYSRSHRR